MLHAHLYALRHTSFNACCHDAMDYDDNLDVDDKFGKGDKIEDKQSTVKISETMEANYDTIAEIVLKRMGQLYHPQPRNNYTPQAIQGPFRCGKCGRDHKTELCTVYPSRSLPPSMWCDVCRWNYTHKGLQPHTTDAKRVYLPFKSPIPIV